MMYQAPKVTRRPIQDCGIERVFVPHVGIPMDSVGLSRVR